MNAEYISYLTMAGLSITVKSDLNITHLSKTLIFMKDKLESNKNEADIIETNKNKADIKENNKNETDIIESNKNESGISEDDQKADVIYNIKSEDFCIPSEAKEIYASTEYTVYSDDVYYYTRFPVVDNHIHSQIILKRKKVFDRDYYMYIKPRTEAYFLDHFKIYGYMAFEEVLMNYNAIILHSSFIKWNNSGILFSAPSGTGKSTQADLWEKHEGAEILNGDRTIIRKVNEKYYGYGSVFAGSSNIYKNECAEIRAIVQLSQHKENIVTRQKSANEFTRLYAETTNNIWNLDFSYKVIDILGGILDNVPIYHLQCRPDKEAVEVLKKEILKTENSDN